MIRQFLAASIAVAFISGAALPSYGHSDDADRQSDTYEFDAAQQQVVNTLRAYADAYEAADPAAIRRLIAGDDEFSFFEGAGADNGWDEFARHAGKEMAAFSEGRYAITAIAPVVDGTMAFATFNWAFDVIILSEQFEGGRHPVSMSGLGTAVLVKRGDAWRIRHLHTARAKAAG